MEPADRQGTVLTEGLAYMAVLPYILRRVMIVGAHLAIWSCALLAAFVLRFEFVLGPDQRTQLLMAMPMMLAVRFVVTALMGGFHGLWRYTSLHDLLRVVGCTCVASVGFYLAMQWFGPHDFPRSIYLIDCLLAISSVVGLRLSVRMLREISVGLHRNDSGSRMLMIGAGNAAEMFLRDLNINHHGRFHVVGLLDDHPYKRGETLHGVRVLGRIADLTRIVENHTIDEIVLAIPSLGAHEFRALYAKCRATGLPVRTLPSSLRITHGPMTFRELQPVSLEDLLRREPVQLDDVLLRGIFSGARVMVTGAGGSIGSELCRQVMRFSPKRLILVEQAEGALFQIEQELLRSHPSSMLTPAVCNVADTSRLQQVMRDEAPSIVLHAAAHKHVPLMEAHPGEAVKNNLLGTHKLLSCCEAMGVERFVLVSTDKAVNPSSVMGATKRGAELVMQAFAGRSHMNVCAVRFGNVLGSAGSVVPIFQEQIKRGGPVTITDPEMTRYFMTIPEASQLILQAGVLGSGGEIFILDMGEPVRIMDLARDLIELSGFVLGRDIDIKFTGLRPGEKLFEELALDHEDLHATSHLKIMMARKTKINADLIDVSLADLAFAASTGDHDEIRQALARLVPECTWSRARARHVMPAA